RRDLGGDAGALGLPHPDQLTGGLLGEGLQGRGLLRGEVVAAALDRQELRNGEEVPKRKRRVDRVLAGESADPREEALEEPLVDRDLLRARGAFEAQRGL